jgi:putative ABC transport system permease protein
MEIIPILSALRRSKVGAVLICLQIALTLAIVCNALFIIGERAQRMQRPSGVDEQNIITLTNQWVGRPDDVAARVRADLEGLRTLPGVLDAVVANSFPHRGGGWSTSFSLEPSEEFDQRMARGAQYFLDEHVRDAWGLKLIEGRWFQADEVVELRDGERPDIRVVILSKALAEQLFSGESAVNRTIYTQTTPLTVVGVVERLQSPWAATGFGESFVENSAIMPILYVGSTGLYYTIRTEPGRQSEVLHAAPEKLLELSRARVVDNVRTFAETRALRYRGDSALTKVLTVACVLLLAVTACGIVGLTSYWIAQRRRQIGVRRALGATRLDILRYFHLENLLIAVSGALIGSVATLALNAWTVSTFEMQRLGPGIVLAAAAAVILLSQLAVLWPALRAASIPPATATRAV